MKTSNVKFILKREVRDQFRDRRTLFMIIVLPLLLYPLMGMSFFQISQFLQERPTSVLIVGHGHLPEAPVLVENTRFAENLFGVPNRRRLLEVHYLADDPEENILDPRTRAQLAVRAGEYDAALYIPSGFGKRLDTFRDSTANLQPKRVRSGNAIAAAIKLPVASPEIIYTTASEKSQITFARLSRVLQNWTLEVGKANLTARGVPAAAAKPFVLESADLASSSGRQGVAVWAKILPILLVLWALTGAFYPAVDLCAGEKERGTLETLLISPAERSEIVVGKLLTVMLFSLITAVLNLASIVFTGWIVLAHLPGFGAPPVAAILWLLIALIPVSAFFSALCLSLAAFARSTKEGQYYLMPLLMIAMPLVILPMAPGVELNFGNSLIPVAGIVLLLRSALEGNYAEVFQFLPIVVMVTGGGCFLAIRWAIEQFNSESVLFRESERFEVGLWFNHLLRDRQPTPAVAAAFFCGITILLIKFFMSFAMPMPKDFNEFALLIVVTQLAVILSPAIIMTVMLTSSPRKTLLLQLPKFFTIPAAVLLALAVHPVVNALQTFVVTLYPVSAELEKIEGIFKQAPSFGYLVVFIAIIPAICEELAFRGFILSGFRHLGHKWRAIMYSAIFFGLTHAILQQSIIAFIVGILIGYLAVQSGSILPCILFHISHNGLALAFASVIPKLYGRWPVLENLIHKVEGGGLAYNWQVTVAGVAISILILAWFGRIRYVKSDEERFQETLQRGGGNSNKAEETCLTPLTDLVQLKD